VWSALSKTKELTARQRIELHQIMRTAQKAPM